MFERIKHFFMRLNINKTVVDSLKEQNQELKEKVAKLEEASEKKFCSHCKERKPITEFNKNHTRKDGLQIQCKECHKAMASRLPKKELQECKFTPFEKEYYGGRVVVSERYFTYEVNGAIYVIIDSFRFHYLCEKFWKDLVKLKIEQMIKYNNKNHLWKSNYEYYYKLKAWCQKEQILQDEKQNLNLFQNIQTEWTTNVQS